MPHRHTQNYTVLWFLGISLALHALFVLLFAVWLLFAPKGGSGRDPSAPAPLQLTLATPPPRAKPAANTPAREQFVNAAESTPVEKPVENSPYIGAQNTQAASEKKTAADSNLPQQEGAKIPGLTLQQSEFAQEMNNQKANPAPEQKAPDPQNEPKEKPDKPEAQTAEATQPPPPSAEALPLRPDGTLFTRDKPTDKGRDKGEEAAKPPQAALATTRAPPQEFSAASPYRRKTQLEGGAVLNGDASVAIRETELGRYKQKLFNSIGSRWHLLVQKNGSMLEIGMVRIRFTITADGRIKNLQVLQGEQLSALMRISRQSVFELDQPWEPFSPSMRQQIGDEYTEEVSFTIY
jgi:outer membrane biosynthesis protein TonB